MFEGMSHIVGISGLVVAGSVLSLAIYAIAKWMRSDDPFAVELIGWWCLTDATLMTNLRGWTLCFSSTWLQENRDWVLTRLVVCGALLMTACIGLSMKQGGTNSPYQFLNSDLSSFRGTRWTRSFWARSLASGYASIHLLMFLG